MSVSESQLRFETIETCGDKGLEMIETRGDKGLETIEMVLQFLLISCRQATCET